MGGAGACDQGSRGGDLLHQVLPRLAGVVCNNGCCPLTGNPDSPVIQRDGARDHTVVSSVALGVILAIAAPRTDSGIVPPATAPQAIRRPSCY